MNALLTDAKVGEVVELLTQGSGPLRAIVGAGGGGGSAPLLISVPMDGNKTFAGDDSQQFQLAPITIINNADDWSGTINWSFFPQGAQAGWIVIFAVHLGTPPGTPAIISIQDDEGEFATMNATNCPQDEITRPFDTLVVLYFNGAFWGILGSAIAGVPT